MKKLLFITLIYFTSFSAIAEEVKEAKKEQMDCPTLASEIETGIEDAGECWKDEDCTHRYFGCPWDKGICWYHIISNKEETIADLDKKVLAYDAQCVRTDPELSKQCKEYYDAMTSADCAQPEPFVCLQGRCVTKSAAMLENPLPDEPVDIYGSRKVLK